MIKGLKATNLFLPSVDIQSKPTQSLRHNKQKKRRSHDVWYDDAHLSAVGKGPCSCDDLSTITCNYMQHNFSQLLQKEMHERQSYILESCHVPYNSSVGTTTDKDVWQRIQDCEHRVGHCRTAFVTLFPLWRPWVRWLLDKCGTADSSTLSHRSKRPHSFCAWSTQSPHIRSYKYVE